MDQTAINYVTSWNGGSKTKNANGVSTMQLRKYINVRV